METIEHFYGADLSWVESFAKQYGGKVEGNFIVVPEDIQSGTRYFLDCGEGIVAYYVNVEYKKDLHLIQKNPNSDFVGFYYNLTDGEATVSIHNSIYDVSRWQYNLSVIDGTLESEYSVKKGSRTFALCIFIKKRAIRNYVINNQLKFPNIDEILNPQKNTIVRFDRMSSKSFHILNDLKKKKVGGSIFDLNLIGTVHMLIANYLNKLSTRRIIIQTVNRQDLASIIASQMYLIENIKDHFPSIKLLAKKANMSEAKFKMLFNKITGNAPNVFFMENKLFKAIELLETKQFSISQISDQLNFANGAHFSTKFKERFGVSPKTYIQEL
ncbi:AraC family transcriptional regulator [Flavobacterium sp. UW10123]|uniref:helix-turn-helix domain-containing protein n=1 Tax=Flavobacterium sp. UW10123 TaxID=3230800 RepID=UPI00339159D6